MRGTSPFTLFAAAALLAGCATTTGSSVSAAAMQAPLLSVDGSSVGTVVLTLSAGGEIEISADNLPPGPHGAHLHAVGRCDGPDFASAGPHLNPHTRMHGRDNPQGSHLGDLPNLDVAADGKGKLTFTLEGTRAELESQLFDADGTALVIHAAADDYRTDPSGNSGARIACALLKRG